MNVESFCPINTKEKVDAIINLIQANQEPKSVYTDVIMYIKKVKIQLYFKEKFESIKKNLPCDKLNKENPISCKKKQVLPNTLKREKPTDKPQNIIQVFTGMKIRDLSVFIHMAESVLISIIKQKIIDKNISHEYILREKDVYKLLPFLENAYNIKVRKEKEEKMFNHAVKTAGYYRKLMEEKFKPSMGIEGDYHRLIYIPTKT